MADKVGSSPLPPVSPSPAREADPAPGEAKVDPSTTASAAEPVSALGVKLRADALEKDRTTEFKILFGNPSTDAAVRADVAALAPKAISYALQKLEKKHPEVDQSFALRFLQWATVAGTETFGMVYAHEMGHADEVKKLGGDPKIEMTGIASGVTWYRLPPGTVLTDKDKAVLSAAGVNTGQLTAQTMFSDWAKAKDVDYAEAMGYLLEQTNLGLYAGRTWAREHGGTVPAEDDIASYVKAMQKSGKDLTTGQLFAMAAAADLLSAPVWAAAAGQLRYLKDGTRSVQMPIFKLGDVKTTFPHLGLYLTPEGPVGGANLVVGPDTRHPVEVSFNARVDGKAFAAGVKVNALGITDRVTVNPFLRGTWDAEAGRAGVLVGSEAKVRLWENERKSSVDLVGSVAYQRDDLLGAIEGRKDGVTAYVGVQIALP